MSSTRHRPEFRVWTMIACSVVSKGWYAMRQDGFPLRLPLYPSAGRDLIDLKGVPVASPFGIEECSVGGREGFKGKTWILSKGSSIHTGRGTGSRGDKWGLGGQGEEKGRTLTPGLKAFVSCNPFRQRARWCHPETCSTQNAAQAVPTHPPFCPKGYLRLNIPSMGVSHGKLGSSLPL